jgi:hypothetical protein
MVPVSLVDLEIQRAHLLSLQLINLLLNYIDELFLGSLPLQAERGSQCKSSKGYQGKFLRIQFFKMTKIFF